MTGLIEGFLVGDGFGGAAASAVAGAGTSAVAVAAAGASATGAGTSAVTAASVLVSEGFGGAGASAFGAASACGGIGSLMSSLTTGVGGGKESRRGNKLIDQRLPADLRATFALDNWISKSTRARFYLISCTQKKVVLATVRH